MIRGLVLVPCLTLLVGCRLSETGGRGSPGISGHATVRIGESVRGEAIETWLFAGRAPATLVVGGIHGDEPSSTDLVVALRDALVEKPELRGGRTVIIVPRANPDGLRARTRQNARGVDLNRNFPTKNFAYEGPGGRYPLSEPESRALVECIRRLKPDQVISVHAPLRCVDPDGVRESQTLASRLAAVGGLPVRDLPEHPGSMGTYVGVELELPMVTYELEARDLDTASASMQRHLQALIAAVGP